MANLNKVMLIGNLTRDVELRFIPNGTATCDLTLAINRKTQQGNEVTFVDVTLWGRTAENVANYMRKGSPIYIEGRLQLNSWEKDGNKYQKLKIVGENVQFLGSGEKRTPVPPESTEPTPDFGCQDEIPF